MDYLSSSFFSHWQQNTVQQALAVRTASDVEQVLNKVARAKSYNMLSVDDLATLISDAANPYLEVMAQLSQQLTRQRFGHALQLFIPLYLSNLCANECSYCGFSMSNKIKRKTLTWEEVDAECLAIKAMGYDAILLVTGEHETKVGMAYFEQILPIVKKHFSYVMLECQPLSQHQYALVKQWGVDAVMVYQETYHKPSYQQYHLRGNKRDFRWRLEAPDRLGAAKMDKVGLGCLFGLHDSWQEDALSLASHLQYLQKRYWRTRYSVAFPRLRPCTGNNNQLTPQAALSDRSLTKLICAFRLFNPQLEVVLSTREPAKLRDNLLPLGVTHLSAGSQTQPGGYVDETALKKPQLAQFDIDDVRAPAEVAASIKHRGFDVIWTDWNKSYSG
ncbi:2-iminoacetate synthase ThiH [Flocculibacter collagenilyticus]|uniref:2-iminoacetate synthase ThiH n=1 Tax=Flocculibacter collagenilyticus TaxID=2744479 RepID=UPI0018F33D8E|nr:2-iminoacetate synthase ThiH [Flocculibacter collagenilyticus]